MTFRTFLSRYAIFVALAIECLVVGLATDSFFTSANLVNVLRQPSVREQFEATAQTVVGSTPAELAATVSRDLERMEAVFKRSGLPKR